MAVYYWLYHCGSLLQEAGASLFAGKTAFEDAVKSEVSAVPQALPPQSAFSKASAAGMGGDFGSANGQVRHGKAVAQLQFCFSACCCILAN